MITNDKSDATEFRKKKQGNNEARSHKLTMKTILLL